MKNKMITVKFEHDIGDKVRIKDYHDIEGRVCGISKRVYGIEYCVVWWHSGERKQEWLHDWEIEAG